MRNERKRFEQKLEWTLFGFVKKIGKPSYGVFMKKPASAADFHFTFFLN